MRKHHLFIQLFWGIFVAITVTTALTGCEMSNDQSSPAPEPARPSLPTPEQQPQTPTPAESSTSKSPLTSQPPLPDLLISDIKIEPKPNVVQGRVVFVRGTAYAIRFEVTNRGPGSYSKAIVVSVDYGCSGPGLGRTGDSVFAASGLAVGETRLSSPYTFELPVSKPHGTCNFEFKVDPDNIIAEADEGNNEWKTTASIH